MNRILQQGGSVLWKLMVLVFTIALLATVLVPLRRKKLEEHQMLLTRLHLVDIYLAERFFFEGRQYYTSDPDSLLRYINYVRSIRIDTVSTPLGLYYAEGDSIRETDLWKIVEPRERINSFYVSPVDSSDYLLIVKSDGISITVKDIHGIGRIEDGEASWLQGRKGS